MSKYLLLALLIFPLNLVARVDKCVRDESCLMRYLTTKKGGWKYEGSEPINFEKAKGEIEYIFFFKGNYNLEIKRQSIKDNKTKISTLYTTKFFIKKQKNGLCAIHIVKFNPDIEKVVRQALKPSEITLVSFEVLVEQDKLILRSYTSDRDAIENFFR